MNVEMNGIGWTRFMDGFFAGFWRFGALLAVIFINLGYQ